MEDGGDHGRALRKIVLVALALLAVVGASAFVLRSALGQRAGAGRTAEPPPDLRETSGALAGVTRDNWSRADFIQPREEKVDPATGEVVLPFQGFAVSLESVPPGARVILDGREVGESPLIASVDCVPEAEVRIRIEKETFRSVHRVTRCRPDTLVKITVRLVR